MSDKWPKELGGRGDVSRINAATRLRFARQILLCLFLLCILVFSAYWLQPESPAAAAVFELVKVGVLPLVTLVIGFYFPSSKRN
ncbi:hypothetical protein [Pseudoduganella violacea]|uniref:Uncharacterized protein n=1 Tax=Pseudoduganella violacea TaxID=1715466 RepID=A0A7W5FT97_9BURK|nr:hypothetical protein [Pseudoduganella violacea]MBB3118402.1 hypothetical protein [Pseudoduganella violacea]